MKKDICELVCAGTMICVYKTGSVMCKILYWLLTWAITAVCFVIGMIGVIVPAVANSVIWAVERSAYYISVTYTWLAAEYAKRKPQVKAQMVYLVDFRNDILHDCGRGDAYEYEDEF